VIKPNNAAKKWKLTSLDLVWHEGWYVKASVSSLNSLCIVMYNETSDQCYTQFFDDETQANRFVEYIIEKHA